MNHREASEALGRLLTNSGALTGDVIALTGPWGCGKTYLWQSLKMRHASDPTIGKALYASLFGVDTLDEIKLRLIQSKVKHTKSRPWHTVTHAAKALAAFSPPGQKVLELLPHALSPFILQDQLLVLDDIERCTESLKTGVLLGFVDEMRTRYGCRILLVFNDAELNSGASKTWQQLREKVVDHEIVLSPSPEDSWSVAQLDARFHSPTWAELVRAAVTECGITNIRVMDKISWVATDILKDYPNISNEAAARIASTVTLLTAVYYQGIAGAPSIRDLYTDAATDSTWQRFLKDSKLEGTTQAGWASIAQRLGIYGGGELENAVIGYLTTGWQSSTELASAIQEVIAHADRSDAANLLHDFLMDDYWNPRLTDAERLAAAGVVAGRSHLLELRAMSQFLFQLDEIPGSVEIADSSFSVWREHNRNPVHPAVGEDAFGRPLHPRMVEYLREAASPTRSPNVFQIFRRLNFNDIRFADLDALDALSVEEYVALVSHASSDQLQSMFPAMWRVQKLQFADGRTTGELATQRFIEACRRLYIEGPSGLSRLIRDQLSLAPPPIAIE